MMAEIFLHLVNMSITAGWLILVVVLLRLILKKAPKWIHCLLWGMVGIRLIFPISIESMFSLVPSADTLSQEILYDASPTIDSGVEYVNQIVNPVLQEHFSPNHVVSVNPLQIVTFVAANIWILGMIVLLLYTAITYSGLKRSVREAVRFEGNVYQSEKVDAPFVFGIIRPRIYIPYGLQGEELQCVIAHEQAHIKRRDHLWKPIAFLVLTIYWFNPLVWVAYILLCRDIEFACDEKVMAQLGTDMKKIYSTALLHCSVSGGTSHRMIAACPVAFGEVGVKQRIRSVLHYKKPAFWIVVVAIIACLVCVVCFMTNPKDSTNGTSENHAADSEALFEMSGIDVSTIQWENITQIAIYADGYYGRTLEQPLLVTGEEQIDKLIELANPTTQEYKQAEEKLEGLCGIFVDFENGVVLSMYVGENYGVISDIRQTTGSTCVIFPQELYNKVSELLSNNVPMQKDTYQMDGLRDAFEEEEPQEVLQNPPIMALQDALSSEIAVGETFTEEVNNLSGVTMSMWKYKATEGDVEISNETDKELQYGDYYDIQVQKDGEWYSLQSKAERVFHAIAYRLPAGEEGQVWSVDWEYFYGALPVGKYRIVKDIMDYRAPGDYTKYYLAAEFEIMQSE